MKNISLLLVLVVLGCSQTKILNEPLEKKLTSHNEKIAFSHGNKVRFLTSNGIKQVPLSDITGDGISDGIDIDGNGIHDFTLLGSYKENPNPTFFIIGADVNADSNPDFYLHVNAGVRPPEIFIRAQVSGSAAEIKFLVDGSQNITGTDMNGDDVSDSAIMNGKAIINTGETAAVENPAYSPVAGVYGSAQNVTLTSATAGATICYTVDGIVTPGCNADANCTAGNLYISPIDINVTTTLRSIACKTGSPMSAITNGVYTIDTSGPSMPGSFMATPAGATQINLTWNASADDVTLPANIVYEICQSSSAGGCATFTATFTTSAGAENYSVTELTPLTMYYFVIRARDELNNSSAVSPETSASTNSSGTVDAPVFSPSPGLYATAQNVSMSSTTGGATICFTTDGVTDPACDVAATCTTGITYSGPLNTPISTYYKALACRAGYTNSIMVSGGFPIGVDTWDDTTRPKVLVSSALVKPNINVEWGPLASAVKYRLYTWNGSWNYTAQTVQTTMTFPDTQQWKRICAQDISLVDFHCSVFLPPPHHATATVSWQTSWADYFPDSSVAGAYYLHNPAQAAEIGGYIQLNQNLTDNGPILTLYHHDDGLRYTRIHFKKYFHRNGTNFGGDFVVSDYYDAGKNFDISMFYTDYDAKYGLNYRENYYDQQNLTPSGYNWTTLDATQRFDEWLDYEIIIDRIGKTLRICQNGICYNQNMSLDFSGNYVLQHSPGGWFTGHFVRIDDYEVESSDSDFPFYPTPGSSLLADVSYFGEQYQAAANGNSWNGSHGANFIEDNTGKQHFAFSDNGTTKYLTSTDKGGVWNSNNPTSARAEKASMIGLTIGNDGNPLIVGTHDVHDFDGNMSTDNPGNYTRELFEAVYDGSSWNYQGIKRAWNWFSPAYGYVQTLSNIPSSYVIQYPVILPNGDFSYGIEQSGWYTYGHLLREISRSSGIWNTAYSAQNYTSDGVLISGDTSAYPDATLQTPFALLARPDGTLFSFYNKAWDHTGVAPCQVYYRSKPNAGSWGSANLLAANGRGWSAKFDPIGNYHLLYSGCNTSSGGSTETLYYSVNGGAAELITNESAGDLIWNADLHIAPSGRVTAVWSIANSAITNFKEIRYAERSPEGVWTTAANLTSGYTGYGKNSPYFVRGNRYDVFPRRPQLVYNENYNDGTDKKRIMLYTFPDF